MAATTGNEAAGSGDQRPMITRKIPRSGETLPVIGLGTWQAFDIAGNTEAIGQAREALRAFVAGGGRMVDSSPMYGSAEAVVGELADEEKLHRSLFVATKVWTSGRNEGIRQMEASVRKLRTDRAGALDLMQVHNLVDTDTHLATLRGWKREGRVRYLGITHYTASAHLALERAMKAADVDFIQVNYSLAEPAADARLLDAAADAGIAVIINRPYAEGAMISRTRGHALPSFAAELGATSWAQLFLKWLIGHPAVTCIIPGTRNPRHVADNLAGGRGSVPDGPMRKRIRAAFEAL